MILLSYPRSGSTWLRYCIEFLSKRPTGIKGGGLGDHPICEKISNLGVNIEYNSLLYKSHNIVDFNTNYDDMIVIIRNYKEVFVRHSKSTKKTPIQLFDEETVGFNNKKIDYIKIIQQYDSLNKKKLLIYYEDLIRFPEKTLKSVNHFLDIDNRYLDDFIKNYEYHKTQGTIAYHDTSYTKGNDLNFHKKSLNNSSLNYMTTKIKSQFPEIFDKYLRRYE